MLTLEILYIFHLLQNNTEIKLRTERRLAGSPEDPLNVAYSKNQQMWAKPPKGLAGSTG